MKSFAEYQNLDDDYELIFDEQEGESSKILEGWILLREIGVEFLGKPLKQPRFLDDRIAIPIQAADLCAGIFRKRWEATGTILEKRVPTPWEPRGRHRGCVFEYDETSLREVLGNILQLYLTDKSNVVSRSKTIRVSTVTYSIGGKKI